MAALTQQHLICLSWVWWGALAACSLLAAQYASSRLQLGGFPGADKFADIPADAAGAPPAVPMDTPRLEAKPLQEAAVTTDGQRTPTVTCSPHLAKHYVASDRKQEAREILEACVASRPGDGTHDWNLGVLLLSMNDKKGAIRHMKEAVRLSPDRAEWLEELSVVMWAAGKQKPAIAVKKQAIAAQFQVKSWVDVPQSAAATHAVEQLVDMAVRAVDDDTAQLGFDVLGKIASNEHVIGVLMRHVDIAVSAGRILDGLALNTRALRRRIEQVYAARRISPVPEDKYALIGRRALLLATGGLESYITAIARSMLNPDLRPVVLQSIATVCGGAMLGDQEPVSIPRADLVAILSSCLDAQAVIESMVMSDAYGSSDAVRQTNAFGWTSLHHAAAFGNMRLMDQLLNTETLINAQTNLGLTPLHVAVTRGHANMFHALHESGASVMMRDDYYRTPVELWCAQAWSVRPDFVNCSDYTPSPIMQRAQVQAPSGDSRCAPIKAVANITAAEFVQEFLSTGEPVLLKGAASPWASPHWAMVHHRFSSELTTKYGNERVTVSTLPYGGTFGLATRTLSLKEYVEAAQAGPLDSHMYAFESLWDQSPILENVQPPAPLNPAVTNITASNVQFFAGPAGTGAPMHFHRSAWNALIVGTKQWYVLPPPDAVYSIEHPQAWASRDLPPSTRCIRQEAGDVVFVPEGWAHAVINQEWTVGFASEFEWGAMQFSIDV